MSACRVHALTSFIVEFALSLESNSKPLNLPHMSLTDRIDWDVGR